MLLNAKGLGFGSVLFFIFLVMKFMHYIDWSWWWVTVPLWLPIALTLGAISTLCIIALIMMLIGSILAVLTRQR